MLFNHLVANHVHVVWAVDPDGLDCTNDLDNRLWVGDEDVAPDHPHHGTLLVNGPFRSELLGGADEMGRQRVFSAPSLLEVSTLDVLEG
ncbi:hypothetical protein D3C86_1809510 [compost metagenome]